MFLNSNFFFFLLYIFHQVSEGAARHSTVVRVTARDPEGATVTYSIISGDNGSNFAIGESTGVIRVMKPLDRENQKSYTLVRSEMEFGFPLNLVDSKLSLDISNY